MSSSLPVIFIAGSGHTGSTLLALLLDSHPEIACVGEISVKPKIRVRGDSGTVLCSCGKRIPECAFWTDVFARVRGQGLAMGPDRWSNDYRFEHPFARRVINRLSVSEGGRRLMRWSADHLPAYRDRISKVDKVNVAFMRAVVEASGARVFADTTKSGPRLLHLLRLPELDTRVVVLVRDVRGYAASAKRRGISPSDAALTWKRNQITAAALGAQAPGSRGFHRLRYEDLCANPAATLKALWAFCGVADVPAPDVLDASEHHVLGNNMRMAGAIRIRLDQSWKDRLEPQEVQAIMRIAGDLNRELGYD